MTLSFSFGTAGIRAAMGERDDQLNPQTVRAICYAIMRQLETLGDDVRERGICVGFDGRAHSREFAEDACRVALAAGFQVRLFEHEAPTPLVAFATRSTNAVAGLVITASHNPARDNGIKLYMQGGGQVLAPHDHDITRRIACTRDMAEIPLIELGPARTVGRLKPLDAHDFEAYFHAIEQLVPTLRDLPLPKLAYSAMCGVGSPAARALLQRIGASEVIEVPEQAQPRSDFGGLRSPNPEDPAALEKLRTLASARGAHVAFASDPDADRLAVVVRDHEGTMRTLSGDDVGALLGSFLLELHPAPSRALLVSTHVSGGLLERIAAANGAHFLRTATGFKWIASQGRSHAAEQDLDLLFGYEEAIGYAFFAMAEDKDGIAALYVLCELVRRLHAKGRTLLDRLDELALQHGRFVTRQMNIQASGPEGTARIAAIMQRLRECDANQLLGSGATSTDFAQASPALELLVLQRGDTRVCVRPSGTEPKLKLYLHTRESVASASEMAAANERATATLDTLEQKLRALCDA